MSSRDGFTSCSYFEFNIKIKHDIVFQVDLQDVMRVWGTMIQGRPYAEEWVTSYKLQYSKDLIIWTTYTSSDGSEKVS